MANLYAYQESNIHRTWLLFGVFFVVVMGLGWVFSQAYGDSSFILFALIFSVVYSLISYYSSASIALSLARAKQIEKKDAPELYNAVENLCIASGLPMPKVYITPEEQINAFATGRDPKHAAIAVTAGALQRLNKTELEGVLAHELSHVGNRDILVSTVAGILAGIISLVADIFLRSLFFGGFGGRNNRDEGGGLFLILGIALSILAPIGSMLIQLAISRRREALADASGVLLTRYPQGLISALEKIAVDNVPMASAKDSTAHMWIDTPFKGQGVSWWHKIWMTHPPIQDRIAALKKL
ncbi:MAG: M48 family metallopeptidase [Patescibacteria group bacterium]|nr:M48 family metallopeptidase [Patescibacteria group bacterium]MDE2015300.1 M48 family metallopeptidase [Patescibacteria group bacterium]MDE2227105.1 M48 family metallopeptidase [Patescibacteria group bacterium]